ncbi:DUF115 domain-containing protein [Lysinibacillus sp. A4]|uniref:motility associated factor glycosyltransferase family protein n=1 Tax=Lysinibacillus sp. A4 TaxID=2976269 RepID=UPI002175BA7A|nr:6-hydroxymethylpterin diphosphokinase MptE-like protein [Lysinibacillus sp. A4]MCS5503257.1 DUF115 domain-containing protein [Lysinibacillus sp. A4]
MTEPIIEVLMSKTGLPIIQIQHNGHMLLIHSKYNPVAEAERLIDSYEEQIEVADHVFCYGTGLGYHVKVLQQRYPDKFISTYEPLVDVHNLILQYAKQTTVNLNAITNQYVGASEEDILRNLYNFRPYLAQNIVIIVHPVYEKIAQKSFQQFSKTFQQFIQDTRTNTRANLAFNDRWVINTIMNTPWILNTPLIQEQQVFTRKPVILVAAGPSLTEELDNLRVIKEEGLAFIFAVGSANEVLIKHNILPDAILSYDPSIENYQVFLELAKQHIHNIPLIFGTTVGHETLPLFSGPKIHMVMNRDKFSTYIQEKVFKIVNDSITISNVTLQLLALLNVEKVILVGQNFAYKKDAYYAKGIARLDNVEYTDSVLKKIESGQLLTVEDVYGGFVYTEQEFDGMRREMEIYIEKMPNLKVINTTQGGAKIKGTIFQSLAETIKSELTEKVVDKEWWQNLSTTPIKTNVKKIEKLQQSSTEYRLLYEEMMTILDRLEKQNGDTNGKKVNQMLDKMYKILGKLTRNQLFELIVAPIIEVHTTRFYSDLKICQQIQDNNEKLQKVIKIYRSYMLITLDIYRKINPIIQLHLVPYIKSIERWEYYGATCGTVQYEGDWLKKWFLRREYTGEVGNYGASAETIQRGAKFLFKFTGTSLQLIGTSTRKSALKLKIIIDQQEQIISIYEHIDEKFSTFHHQVLFETLKLSEGLHEVSVEILSDHVHFNLLGICIQKGERIYHIDEVEKIDNLTIGKRIRCHYQARHNELGEFRNIGDATMSYLPVQATVHPNGDFYFIMVDERAEQKVLIADRILQKRISLHVIEDKQLMIDGKTGTISLLTSSKDVENSEWDHYLVENLNVKCNNLQWHADSFTASWVKDMDDENNDKGLLRGSYIGEDGTIHLDNGFDYHCKSAVTESLNMTGYRPKLVF